jgi:hypothetical protein
MSTSIPITNISNQVVLRDSSNNITSVSGTGVFDILLASFSSFVELQEQNGKLTQSQYAQILSQALPGILNASIDFVTKAPIVEQQIDGMIKDNLVKDQQILESQYNVANMLPKQLEKITSEINMVASQKAMVDQQILTEVNNTRKVSEDAKLTYVTRVAKDKEAALLGLDDVAFVAKKAQNGTSVYAPIYI